MLSGEGLEAVQVAKDRSDNFLKAQNMRQGKKKKHTQMKKTVLTGNDKEITSIS